MAATSRTDNVWLYRAVTAGFVGTVAAGFVLLAGYAVAVGLSGLADPLGGWFAALTRNPATQLVSGEVAGVLLLHFAVGLMFAVFYAAFVEPRLSMPGWQKGMLFSLLPWALSLVLFLPLIGGGLLGLALGAGPLPVLGNLIAHLAYGGTLGWVYARAAADLRDTDSASLAANLGAERGIALGVVGGALLGAAIGLAIAATVAGTGGIAVLAGAAGGATVGAFVGSYLGLGGSPT